MYRKKFVSLQQNCVKDEKDENDIDAVRRHPDDGNAGDDRVQQERVRRGDL